MTFPDHDSGVGREPIPPGRDEPLAFDPARAKVIACATVIEEMIPALPPEMAVEVLDFGLHLQPARLTERLQEAIDASHGYDTILLGYGQCSGGVVGLRATTATLVIPRVDDCIALFLGSREAYREQARREPGTYYLTKGWLEVGDTPFEQEVRLRERYGDERAARIVRCMLRHYRRLAFVNTGVYEVARYRQQAQDLAARYGLDFEELAGSPSLIQKLLYGPWDRECVVVPQGGTVAAHAFLGVAGDAEAHPHPIPEGAHGP